LTANDTLQWGTIDMLDKLVWTVILSREQGGNRSTPTIAYKILIFSNFQGNRFSA
jgi:hypothetical protein